MFLPFPRIPASLYAVTALAILAAGCSTVSTYPEVESGSTLRHLGHTHPPRPLQTAASER